MNGSEMNIGINTGLLRLENGAYGTDKLLLKIQISEDFA